MDGPLPWCKFRCFALARVVYSRATWKKVGDFGQQFVAQARKFDLSPSSGVTSSLDRSDKPRIRADRGPPADLKVRRFLLRWFPLGEGAMQQTFAVGIGGAAGQGVATPGDIFAKIFSRRGLHLNAYNAYQSIIRGGHTFLTLRTGPPEVTNMGDRVDLLIPLNQDSMDRHLQLLTAGAACIYNSDTIKPGSPADGVQLCPLPVSELVDITRNKVAQNTLAIGAGLHMMGIGFQALEEMLGEQFKKKGEAVVAENVGVAPGGFDYSAARFTAFPNPLQRTENRYAILSGNVAMAMGGAAAGVKFYCAYPMSPSTGVLHWMAAHARKAGIMVRQVEDEIGVINMAIGAAHAGR